MVALVIVGLAVVVAFNAIWSMINLFNAEGCLEAFITLVLSALVVAVEVMAIVLLWQLL